MGVSDMNVFLGGTTDSSRVTNIIILIYVAMN